MPFNKDDLVLSDFQPHTHEHCCTHEHSCSNHSTQNDSKSPTTSTLLLISSLETLYKHARDSGLCPIASSAMAASQFQHSLSFSNAIHSIRPPYHHSNHDESSTMISRCNCLDQWRRRSSQSDKKLHHHHHQQVDEEYTTINHNSCSTNDDYEDYQDDDDDNLSTYSDRDDCKFLTHSHDNHHANDDTTKDDDLRKEMRNLCDEQKMQLLHQKMMSQHKRSKAKQLENNIIQLFRNQYVRFDYNGQLMINDPSKSTCNEHGLSEKEMNQKFHGCQHYARKCKIKATCCNLFVSCRFCHDEAMEDDHEMNRFTTEKILCMICLTEQDIGEKCINCNESFAHYFCNKCRFHENSPGKKVYHCDRCNICRLGEGIGIDNFHCDICDACVSLQSKAHHKCLSKALHSNCPVCRGYLFTSTEPVVFMRCGHTMHSKCFDEYTSTSYHCPLCMKSLTNMDQHFERLDEIVRNQRMPQEYQRKRSRILCNDCGNKTITGFHFLYHKCQTSTCNSYNTTVLDVFDIDCDEDSSDLTKVEEQQSDHMVIDSMSIDFSSSSSSRSALSGFTDVSSQYEASISSSYT